MIVDKSKYKKKIKQILSKYQGTFSFLMSSQIRQSFHVAQLIKYIWQSQSNIFASLQLSEQFIILFQTTKSIFV